MSTRSFIGYYHSPGEIRGMYCHYDGYPDHVGAILAKHHNSFAAMAEIIHGGQIRNFDSDGTICRFGDARVDDVEIYVNLAELLNDVYDYVYLFDELDDRWRCYTRDHNLLIKQCEIPAEVE